MSTAWVVVLLTLPPFALLGAMAAGVCWMRRDQRRDPPTSELLRLPGTRRAGHLPSSGRDILTIDS